jgi:ubiquinone biosynthesis protein UbiJ
MKTINLIILLLIATAAFAQAQQTGSGAVLENKLLTTLGSTQTEEGSGTASSQATALADEVKTLDKAIKQIQQQIGDNRTHVSHRSTIDYRLKELERKTDDLDRRVRKLENLESRLRRVERKL